MQWNGPQCKFSYIEGTIAMYWWRLIQFVEVPMFPKLIWKLKEEYRKASVEAKGLCKLQCTDGHCVNNNVLISICGSCKINMEIERRVRNKRLPRSQRVVIQPKGLAPSTIERDP